MISIFIATMATYDIQVAMQITTHIKYPFYVISTQGETHGT